MSAGGQELLAGLQGRATLLLRVPWATPVRPQPPPCPPCPALPCLTPHIHPPALSGLHNLLRMNKDSILSIDLLEAQRRRERGEVTFRVELHNMHHVYEVERGTGGGEAARNGGNEEDDLGLQVRAAAGGRQAGGAERLAMLGLPHTRSLPPQTAGNGGAGDCAPAGGGGGRAGARARAPGGGSRASAGPDPSRGGGGAADICGGAQGAGPAARDGYHRWVAAVAAPLVSPGAVFALPRAAPVPCGDPAAPRHPTGMLDHSMAFKHAGEDAAAKEAVQAVDARWVPPLLSQMQPHRRHRWLPPPLPPLLPTVHLPACPPRLACSRKEAAAAAAAAAASNAPKRARTQPQAYVAPSKASGLVQAQEAPLLESLVELMGVPLQDAARQLLSMTQQERAALRRQFAEEDDPSLRDGGSKDGGGGGKTKSASYTIM